MTATHGPPWWRPPRSGHRGVRLIPLVAAAVTIPLLVLAVSDVALAWSTEHLHRRFGGAPLPAITHWAVHLGRWWAALAVLYLAWGIRLVWSRTTIAECFWFWGTWMVAMGIEVGFFALAVQAVNSYSY